MMKKKFFLFLFLLLLIFTLTGCNSAFHSSQLTVSSSSTHKPIVINYQAPVGNISLDQLTTVDLYLPNKERTKLVVVSEEIILPVNRHGAESVIRKLLSHPGNDFSSPLSPTVELALSDYFPIEISRDTATVNLTQSALQLDPNSFYIVSQAIANTLSSFSDISYVNVLVLGKQIGLDTSDTLPMGTLQEDINLDLISLWEKIESRKILSNESIENKRLSLPVTLYFPIQPGLGILPEVRNIAFTGQSPKQLVTTLLEELSKGSVYLENSPKMPDFISFLSSNPTVSSIQSAAGRKVVLHFTEELYSAIIESNNNLSSTLAALNYTLTTFLPNVVAIEVHIGKDSPITKLNPQSPYVNVSELIFLEGLQKRSDFTPFLLGYADLYFPLKNSNRLAKVVRPVPYYETKNPSYLIEQLIAGPKYYDSRSDIESFFSKDFPFSEADLRGISYTVQRQLLVHFSSDFYQYLNQYLIPSKESQFVYAIVNTLCQNPSINSICFFIDFKQPEVFVDSLYLPGFFYPNPGIVIQ